MTGILRCTKVWTDFATEDDMLIDSYQDTPEVKAFYARYDDANVSVKDNYVSYFAGNKTDLQLITKLRWDLLSKYVDLLVAKEFLSCRKTPKMTTYAMTERGRKFFGIVIICLDCLK